MSTCWNKKKISAYSLTELLVAIGIIVLVMGFAFFTLNYLQQKVTIYTDHLLFKLDQSTTESIIWKDIHLHSLAIVDQRQQQFQLSSPLETITYSFTNRKLIRNEQPLLGSYYRLNFYFQGQEVKNGRFDALEIVLTPSEEKFNALFFFLPQSAFLYS